MKKTIVVTGGAGFIGSNLVERLNTEGFTDIVIVDSLGLQQKWKNLIGLRYQDFIHKNEFLNVVKNSDFLKNCAAIFHLGACSATTEQNADYLMDNNYHYTKSLSIAALKDETRFIYASSAATYGLGELGYDDDNAVVNKLRPLNMYGYSKHLFDQWAIDNKIDQKIVGLKFFNVYGPKEAHKDGMRSMVLKAAEQIQTNKVIKLFKSTTPKYKDGDQQRDFIYVKDCVDVMTWFLNNLSKNGIYNLGTGKARSWNELARAVAKSLNVDVQIEYIDMPQNLRGQYQDFTEAKMDKLLAAGYQTPFTPLEDGVADYIHWLL